MQPWNAVWLEWQPHRLTGLGQPGATTPVRPSPQDTPETLPQGDAKGEPDGTGGEHQVLAVTFQFPRLQSGKRGISLRSSSCRPTWVDSAGSLPSQGQGSGQVSCHSPPKKYEVPVRISSGYETLTSAPSTSSMLMTAWFSCAAKFTSCQKPSFRRYPGWERRLLWWESTRP